MLLHHETIVVGSISAILSLGFTGIVVALKAFTSRPGN
jgi:hypothetical protein